MRLIIGGFGQGKLEYCKNTCNGAYRVLDGETLPFAEAAAAPENGANPDSAGEQVILDRLHVFIRRALYAGKDPEAEADAFVRAYPEADIICDEVGNGVVPIDEEERAWREAVGRTTRLLAERAETVERVICGLPQRIKG